jgi:hypothetical protein
MGKKPVSNAEVLKKHTAALQHHSEQLKLHTDAIAANTASNKAMASALTKQSNALAATIPATARQFVYSVLADFGLKTPVPDTTKLADLGFDVPALAGLADEINGRHWKGVHVDTGAIQACVTIANVITVVAAAM